MKQIFPNEIIENTIEVHRFKNKVSSKIIYSIIIISLIGTFAALPYIYIDIYASATGLLKAKKERNKLSSLYTGKIQSISIEENQIVKEGDTLLTIDFTVGLEKIKFLKQQLSETSIFVHDLTYLSKTKNLKKDSLRSFLYQKQYIQYEQKLRELQTRYAKNKSDFERQDKLFKKNVTAKVEHENSKYHLDLSLNDLLYYKKEQRHQWQSELTQQNNKVKELKSTLLQYKEDQNNYFIKAPIKGTIQNLIGLEIGNFISAGSPIAEISPNTSLIAECYMNPSDIGLLRTGTQVKIQVLAFNYNQWGMATGKIITISNDVLIINEIPMFKITCSIDQTELKLKNGFKGKLKKGMTINARFRIANRSAFNLLYDKVDDWFNPNKS
tara:strand:+ start:5418 stop:6566 length:1149 start_codon:yes stop_codon:yes gene_type:complete